MKLARIVRAGQDRIVVGVTKGVVNPVASRREGKTVYFAPSDGDVEVSEAFVEKYKLAISETAFDPSKVCVLKDDGSVEVVKSAAGKRIYKRASPSHPWKQDVCKTIYFNEDANCRGSYTEEMESHNFALRVSGMSLPDRKNEAEKEKEEAKSKAASRLSYLKVSTDMTEEEAVSLAKQELASDIERIELKWRLSVGTNGKALK